MRGDVILLDEEKLPTEESLRVFHPMLPHISKVYPDSFKWKPLMVPIFQNGKCVYSSPSVDQIRKKTLKNLDHLDGAYKRFFNPHRYHISLSKPLFDIKQRLLRETTFS